MPLRVRQVKLLGELYNYRLVDSQLIFDALYQFIGFSGATAFRCGHATTAHKIYERAQASRKGGLGAISEETQEGDTQQLPAVFADPQHPNEAPWDYFRIKLVCVLLETCAHYYDRGAVKVKLDRFLQFFIRYVHSKGELPLRFMNMVYDVLERLRPKLVFPEQKEKAEQSVLKLLRTERETLDLTEVQEEEAEGPRGGGGGGGGDREDEDSESGSGSEGSDDEDEESESEDEGSSSSEEDSEGEDEYTRRGGGASEQKTQHEQELEDFNKELQQMLITSLEREKTSTRVLRDLPVPSATTAAAGTAGQPTIAPGAFSLVQKRAGGKTLVKQLDVPVDSKLGRVVRSGVQEKNDEKEDLKRFIMQYDPAQVAAQGAAPGGIRMRAGKGSGKVAGRGPRAPKDYVKQEFMPEEQEEPELPAPGTTIRMSGGKGGPRSGPPSSRPVAGPGTSGGYGGGGYGGGGYGGGYGGYGGQGGGHQHPGGQGGPGGGGGKGGGLIVMGGKGSGGSGGKGSAPRRDTRGTPSAPNYRGAF